MNFLKFLLATVFVATFVIVESEGRRNKRWIQSTGMGAYQDDEDASESEDRELVRRAPQEQGFPEYPGSENEFVGQKQYENSEGQVQGNDLDFGQSQDSQPTKNGNYQSGGYEKGKYIDNSLNEIDDVEQKPYYKGEDEVLPWYKKVGRFFKNGYSHIKNKLRRERDYNY